MTQDTKPPSGGDGGGGGGGTSSTRKSSFDEGYDHFLNIIGTPPSSPPRKQARDNDTKTKVVTPSSASSFEHHLREAELENDEMKPIEEASSTMPTTDSSTVLTGGSSANVAVAVSVSAAEDAPPPASAPLVRNGNGEKKTLHSDDNDDSRKNNNNEYDDDDSDRFCGRKQRILFTTHVLFVLGSILYLVISVDDYQWARTLQDLPENLRTAMDDDVPWVQYRIAERYQEYLESGVGGGRMRRKMRMRELRRIEREEAEEKNLLARVLLENC